MVMRMSGLASGMDTQAIVDAMMAAERMPIDRLETEIRYEQNKLNTWSTVETKLSDLKSKSDALVSYSNWSQMSAVADEPDILSATAEKSGDTGTFTVNVSELAREHIIGSDAQADTTNALGLTGEFLIGGQTVSVTSGNSLADIRDAINAAAEEMDDDERVTASIIDTTLVIKRNNTGSTGIDLADTSGTVLEDLGVLETSGSIKNTLQVARDLSMTVNGVSVSRSSNTGIDDVINGATLNITDTGETELTIGHDKDTIKSLIEDFVSSYNNAMAAIEDSSSVEMSTSGDSIDSLGWLQGDQLIRSIPQQLRTLVTGTDTEGVLDDAFDSLREAGIWTTGRDNRLALDSATLDDALTNNFDEVEDLFRDYDGGIMRKIDDYLDRLTSAVDGSITRKTQSIENGIETREEDIADIERRLESVEEQLWEQWANMEESMAVMNSQMSFILSALGSSTGSASSSS